MNLHEECLLKFLLNPMDLSHSTETLKENNSLIENSVFNLNSKKINLRKNCTLTRI
jgi:hypothetical protein